MSGYTEEIDAFERDGWHITVEIEQDWDYRPGHDDDIYPQLAEWRGNETVACEKCEGTGEVEDRRFTDGYRECERCEGTGELDNPVRLSGRGDLWTVLPDEIERIVNIGWGEDASPKDRAKARETILSDAAAIVSEDLSFVGVVVTASRGEIRGVDSLWGIEYDLRLPASERYPENGGAVRDHAMVANAIERAASEVLGGMATQALSY